ncbi:nucleoside-binding protein [Motiliproteus coralliicola]|uniref:Nucleoside-binding protein n=1 Tax=Motiliproteus coralliicola TaxID=2283196 RepID=A0A369WNJ1_9GAMM|nr:nucleoside-binding protein [Motiliproteus coralliicola]
MATTGLNAADWSTTELQLQRGDLDVPSFAGGGSEQTTILTLQHASGWKYGDTFFFVDASKTSDNSDLYAELYPHFSFGKISGKDLSVGPIRDFGLVTGLNFAADANVLKYLPGVRLSLDLPGFAFANLDVTAYIDDSDGVASGGAPAEDDSYMVDFSWAYPFKIGSTSWSVEGHAEYIGSRDNEFGDKVSHHILAQPQLRLDLGEQLFDRAGQLFVGIEYQYWNNKLGDSKTDESVVQALLVWRL